MGIRQFFSFHGDFGANPFTLTVKNRDEKRF